MTYICSHVRVARLARIVAARKIATLAAAAVLAVSSQAAAQNYPDILGSPNVTIDLSVLDALGPGRSYVPPPVYRAQPAAPAIDNRPPPVIGSRGLLLPPAVSPRSAINPQFRALLGLPVPAPLASRILRRLPEPAAAPNTPVPQAAPRQAVRVQPRPAVRTPVRREDAPAVPPPPRMPSPQAAVLVTPPPVAPEGAPTRAAAPQAKPKAEPMVARAAPAPRVAAPAPAPVVEPRAGQLRQALAAPPPRVAAPAPAPMPRADAQPPKPPPAPVRAPPPAPVQQAAAVPETPPAAAAPVAAPPPEVAALPPAGRSSAGDRLLFATGSAKLADSAKAVLQNVIGRLSDNEDTRIQLMAYAEGTAETASQARRLSLSRALAVRSYLIEQGVRSTRMDVRALGNNFEDGPADRVDVVLVRR